MVVMQQVQEVVRLQQVEMEPQEALQELEEQVQQVQLMEPPQVDLEEVVVATNLEQEVLELLDKSR